MLGNLKQGHRLVKIKGRRFDRFLEEVKLLRPGARIDVSWRNLNLEDRIARMSSFLQMQGFTPQELRLISRRVFRIKIPFKIIGFIAVILFLSFLGYEYYHFQELPRVYAIGNDVPVYAGDDPQKASIEGRLNIYGLSFSGDNNLKSANSMLLITGKGEMYTVQHENFIKWLLRKNGELYLNKTDVVKSLDEYNEFKRIFREVKGHPALLSLNITQRRAIYNCIKSTNDFYNAAISNSFSKTELENFKPIATANGDNENYIFITLKTQNGKFENIKIILKQGDYSAFKELEYLEKPFDSALMYKDSLRDNQQENPIMMYRQKSPTTIYQCVAPPYDDFTK